MKNVFSFMLAFGLVVGLASCNQLDSSAVEVEQSEAMATNTVSMKVDGMVCASGCAGKIEKTLNETSGVAVAEVDFENGTCVVEYDESAISKEEIVEVVAGVNDGAYAVALVSNESSSSAHSGCSAEEKAACKKNCTEAEKAACSASEKAACQDKAAKDGVTKEA